MDRDVRIDRGRGRSPFRGRGCSDRARSFCAGRASRSIASATTGERAGRENTEEFRVGSHGDSGTRPFRRVSDQPRGEFSVCSRPCRSFTTASEDRIAAFRDQCSAADACGRQSTDECGDGPDGGATRTMRADQIYEPSTNQNAADFGGRFSWGESRSTGKTVRVAGRRMVQVLGGPNYRPSVKLLRIEPL